MAEELRPLRPQRINRGAFCYGDSGGPLWVYDDKNDDKVPVEMGVYGCVHVKKPVEITSGF